MVKRVSILGVTGSIGMNTVAMLKHLGGREAFQTVAVTGGANIAELAVCARDLGAEIAVTAYEDRLEDLQAALAGSGVIAAAGEQALLDAASRPADWVMAAIVGVAGLAPTLAAAQAGATVALANKECLVSAGSLFLEATKKAGVPVIPVDSEHSAIFQCLDANAGRHPSKFILTASGGPFRSWTRAEMADVTAERARQHPNFSMGLKISIDSATMFNKALEMIEARWLFGATSETLDVVVHRQSIIHSAVAYSDGAMIAQLGLPDMRTAIGYALTYPERADLPVETLDLTQISRLDFEPPDEARFPSITMARAAMDQSELAGAALNAAKEEALVAFIEGHIKFLHMFDVVAEVVERLTPYAPARDLRDVFEIDRTARHLAAERITKLTA